MGRGRKKKGIKEEEEVEDKFYEKFFVLFLLYFLPVLPPLSCCCDSILHRFLGSSSKCYREEGSD